MKSMLHAKSGSQRSGTWSIQLPLVALLVALFSLVPFSLMGGIGDVDNGDRKHSKAENQGSAENGPKSNREAKNGMDAKEPSKAISEIKCWQKGQLILHEKNWELESGTFKYAGIKFASRGNGYSYMQLGSLGETFCYVKSR